MKLLSKLSMFMLAGAVVFTFNACSDDDASNNTTGGDDWTGPPEEVILGEWKIDVWDETLYRNGVQQLEVVQGGTEDDFYIFEEDGSFTQSVYSENSDDVSVREGTYSIDEQYLRLRYNDHHVNFHWDYAFSYRAMDMEIDVTYPDDDGDEIRSVLMIEASR